MLVVITIFIAICFAMVGVYSMGIVPTIFDTKEETTNQTKLIIDYFEGQNKLMIDQFHRENNTTQKLLIGLNDSRIMIEKLNESLQQNLNISKEHQTVAKDHDSIQTIQGRLLQNLTEELKEIKTLHKEIKQEIESINNNSKS
jgi:hypothetical protein